MSINTAKVTGRRSVRFETVDDALAEAERLASLERQGKLKLLGNWSFGQILNHLATWTEYSYEGFPLKPPLVIRLLIRPFKGRFIRNGLPAGRTIPRVPGGTLGIEPASTEQGLDRFRKAMQRLKTEAPTHPSPIFGTLKHDEWTALALRHIELHVSFATEA